MQKLIRSKCPLFALWILAMGITVTGLAGSFTTDFSSLPANAQLYGGTRPDGVTPYPAVTGGMLQLTYAYEQHQVGSMVIDVLDAGQQIGSFTANFKLLMGGGTGGNGVSFNFAPDLPDAQFGQNGAGTGLTVVFNSFDNLSPSVDIKWGGVVVQHKTVPFALLDVNQFVDVVVAAKADGSMYVTYGTNVIYTNVFAYVPTSGRFGLGAAGTSPTDNHWVDALSITTTPLAAPFVSLARPAGANASATPQIHIEIQDFNTQVNASTVQMQFDGVSVAANKSKVANVTTVTYSPPGLQVAGSTHTVILTYMDSGATQRQVVSAFTVANYISVPGSIALSAGDVDLTKPGFRVRPVQAREGANLVNSLARTDAQLAGTLIDPTTQLPFDNKAVIGPNADGSYDEGVVIDYSTIGNPFPGIPGTEGLTDFCAEDVLTYLQLAQGYYVFGVNSDDGFRVSTGADPRDAFASVLGQWDGTRTGGGDTTFSFVAGQAGLYPFRLVWENGTGNAGLRFYSVSQTDGSQILINDTSSPDAVKAFRVRKVATALPAYILSASPRPGEVNVSRRPTVTVVLLDDGTQVVTNSVNLSLDGTPVTAKVVKAGNQTTVTYQPPTALDNLSSHSLSLVFSDNGAPANVRTQVWAFTTARTVQVAGQWDFDKGDLRATIGHDLQYGDAAGETAMKDHTSFGTTTSFGIPDIGGRPAKVMKYTRDENPPLPIGPRGYICEHGMAPNGGGTKVNQFTMIVDMMIPDLHMGDGYNTVVKWEAVDDWNIDGSISIQANDKGGPNTGGIGISAQYSGDGVTYIIGGKWQRVAVVVDMAATPPTITYYIDGVRFGQMTSGDRWGFDQRHAIPPVIRMFADGEADNEVNTLYVNSLQFRDGTMTDAEVAALGAASVGGIPYPGFVGGQWDFDQGDLRATIGHDLQYGDAPGETAMFDHTSFGTTTSFGIPDIGGQPAKVMKYTRDENPPLPIGPRGYICNHGLIPNGGGAKVNEFTMIVDMMIPDLHMGDGYNTVVKWEAVDDWNIDGSISIQANDKGGPNTGGIGISAQYSGDGVTYIIGGKWQRVAVVVDMAAAVPTLTYYIDGVRFGQMTSGDRWGFDQRHAIPPVIRMFADGEADNEVNTLYVNSLQFRDGTMTDAQAAALGAASANGIPVPVTSNPKLVLNRTGSSLTISWDSATTGFILESAGSLTALTWTPVPNVVSNSVTVTIGAGNEFFRLKNQ